MLAFVYKSFFLLGDGIVSPPEQEDKKPTKDSAPCGNVAGAVPRPCSCLLCYSKISHYNVGRMLNEHFEFT